ncbi:amino acid lyase [Alphaproteobacteria bacterium]|nr:amino acid lyase [Alphaproteobacteria bacterium]GHS96198.1 amino acid lyase [Alphaproteobacteria bacterium]
MIEFSSDYNEGAHPRIIKRLEETNMEQTFGYGMDPYCEKALALIRTMCGNDDLAVHLMVGGTMANLTVIAASLRPHQAVIAPTSGHINVQETGSIEATGHKILTVPEHNGKITAAQIDQVCRDYWENEGLVHLAKPKMVYITHPTEYGTLYTKPELLAIRRVCDERNLFLYVDGARLGYGLSVPDQDTDLPLIADCCDVFYIGAGKQGALFGEAVVIKNKAIAEDFRPILKQRGGLLSKGRLLGIQFLTLFEDGLYWELSKHANKMAERIRACLKRHNISFFVENKTNLLFPIFSDALLSTLQKTYSFTYWKKLGDNKNAIRICTSWATTEDNTQKLIADIEKFFERTQRSANEQFPAETKGNAARG